MNYIREALQSLDLLESKEDQQKFIAKFGEKSFDLFNKAKQRLKNNGISTDILWHVKNTDVDKMQSLLLSLYDDDKDAQKKRIIQGTDKEIRGKYKYYGEAGGYKIYEPLDYIASMDLGVNTGWCTTGRYAHPGHPEFTPREDSAKSHFDKYVGNGGRLFYFLDPETMYGEYAVYWNARNEFIRIYNSRDDIDNSAAERLPLDKLPINIRTIE